jgi:hypothetical protein
MLANVLFFVFNDDLTKAWLDLFQIRFTVLTFPVVLPIFL